MKEDWGPDDGHWHHFKGGGGYGGPLSACPGQHGPLFTASGQELRDQGLDRAGSGAPVSVLVSWVDRARIALLWLCEAESSFSAEDLRRAVGEPPTPACMGAVFRSAVKDGIIVPDGVDQARRPERHASLIRMWRRA